MTQARLTGTHPVMLSYTDSRGTRVDVSVAQDMIIIAGVIFPADILEGLAELASGSHLMSDCVWENCPEHACPYDHSHTQHFCGRPTCRVS